MALVHAPLLLSVAITTLILSEANTFDVTQYGAVGDGKTDDSPAFQKAWNATCEAGGSSSLTVPSSKTFFLNPLMFMGPCKSSVIQVQINGKLIAPSSQGAWKDCPSNTWIVFRSVDNLHISGTGTLDANGNVWWTGNQLQGVEDGGTAFVEGVGDCKKPITFRLSNCNSAQLRGVNFLNSGGPHISIDDCKNLNINNINIKAPETSPNTDGIDLYNSSHVMITNSFIGTGDDCIAINNYCSNVNISEIECGPGHGISVGSLGRDGVSAQVDGIYVEHCTFTGTNASARIKTWQGGSGYARNIYYEHLILKSVQSAIEINQYYTNGDQSQGVQVSDVHFTNVQGSGEKILLDCNQNVPCERIFVEQVNVTSSAAGKQVDVTCKNAKVEASVVTPPLPC